MDRGHLPAWIMELLIQRIEKKICALWDSDSDGGEGLGTGAIVSVADRDLILTCAHVASPFFRSSKARVVLIGGTVIPRESCRLTHIDDERDLAVIEVSDERLSGFVVEEIEDIPDYTRYDFSHLDLLVCGFPAERVTVEDRVHTLSPMAFLTGILESPARTKSTMACAYPMAYAAVKAQAGPPQLPRPHGLSGSPLLAVPSPRTPKGKLWSFEDIRIVGVVAMSNVRTFLEANSCFPILEILRAPPDSSA